MTRKDKKKEYESQEPEEKSENEQKLSNEAESVISKAEEKKHDIEKGDVKLLECEDQKILEFFSKDELCRKLKDLEKLRKENEEKLEKFKIESADWKNKYMRLQAEFENAQKRWDKNRQNLRIEYIATVIKSFLPLYDSFKKALSVDNKDMVILKGFYDQFMNILKSYKAEPIETKVNDAFDYNYHEALSSIERADVPNNMVIDVVQDGWKLDKEVIRYTKVILSKEPKPPEPEPETLKEESSKSSEITESEGSTKKNPELKDHKVSATKNENSKPENEYVG